jgi:transposase
MGLSKEFRVRPVYSEELKKKAVFSVLSGEMRKAEAEREYGIRGGQTLDNWLERYGRGILTEHKLLLEGMGTRKKAKPRDADTEGSEIEELRRQVKDLERELEAAKLRAEAYSLMIDLAEKDLKVAIRKKSGTK